MDKRIFFFTLILLIIVIIFFGWYFKEEIFTSSTGTNQQLIIKLGESSRFCDGYCSKEYTISSDRITFDRKGTDMKNQGKPLPIITKKATITDEEWVKLLNSFNINEFISLPDHFGCPGCADGPIGSIEIIKGSIDKEVIFDPLAPPSEIKKFFQEIENII